MHVGQGKFDLVKELYFVLGADKAETKDEGLCTEMLSSSYIQCVKQDIFPAHCSCSQSQGHSAPDQTTKRLQVCVWPSVMLGDVMYI